MAAPAAAIAGIWAALVAAIAKGNVAAHFTIFYWKLGVRVVLFSIKVAALLAIISLLANGVMELFDTFTVVLPPMLGDGIERILPGNFVTCLSAIIATKALVFIFGISSKLISMFLADF